MEQENVHPTEPVDLGAASAKTLGAAGKVIDYVGMMEHWGISND